MKRHPAPSLPGLALALTASWGLAAGPSWVQGVVTVRAGEERRPLPGVIVSLQSPAGAVMATAMTDGQGRYRFSAIPRQTIVIAAERAGFFTERAAGRADSRIRVDCVLECRQDSANFELARGAAISGNVLDEAGEPIERAKVSIRRSGTESLNILETDTSDDRGYYRVGGLRAGKYMVTVNGQTPGGTAVRNSAEIAVGAGEEIEGFNIVLAGGGAYAVSGRVSGVPAGSEKRARLILRPAGGQGGTITAELSENSGFRLDPVPAGRYAAWVVTQDTETSESSRAALEFLNVQGAMEGVLLQPVEPATVTGTVKTVAGALPDRPVIRIASNEGLGRRWSPVRGEERSFTIRGVTPGVYRIEAHSRGFYVKGIERRGSVEPAKEVEIRPGETHLTVIAAADYGRVHGVVRDASGGGPAPLARVALDRDGEKLLVQADNSGRFSFGEVIPGEYRICAWADIAPQDAADEASWRRAGCEFKIITLDAEADIEIDLRAAP